MSSEMVKLISPNVICIIGAKNSAIYDFENKNIYSINFEGTKIIEKYLSNSKSLTYEEIAYLDKVKETANIQEIDNVDYVFFESGKPQLDFGLSDRSKNCNGKFDTSCKLGENFEIDFYFI